MKKLRGLRTISISECKKRRVYKLHSRNLSFGVFDGDTGFIGIRTKFGSRFLDTISFRLFSIIKDCLNSWRKSKNLDKKLCIIEISSIGGY